MSTATATSSAPPALEISIPPNHTLYVNNLNGKVKKQLLRKSLYNLFVTYGRVMGVIAIKGVKMRGQAFIVFDDIQNSTAALRSLQGVVFFEKPMRLSYAKRDSDAIRSSKSQIAEKTAALIATSQPEQKTRKDKPRVPPPPSLPPPDRSLQDQHIGKPTNTMKYPKERRKSLLMTTSISCLTDHRWVLLLVSALMNSEEVNRAANAVAVAEAELQELPMRDRTRRIQSAIAAQTTLIGAAVVPMMTDGPSTPTLFVTNLPSEITREALAKLFREFSGYRDVRLVPGREGIAFIDFDNEVGASAARGKSATIRFHLQ